MNRLTGVVGLGLLVAVTVFGCAHYRTVAREDWWTLGAERPTLRVTLFNGNVYETKHYYVGQDTLYLVKPRTLLYKGHMTAIPFGAIASIARLRVSPSEMAVITVASVAVFYLLLKAASSWTAFGALR